jgi:hypothetical protein
MAIRLLIIAAVVALATGCGISVSMRGPALPPRPPARIIWKAHSAGLAPGSYTLIAVVKKRTTWCGATKARFDRDNHRALARKAGELGGNVIVLRCGAPGTTGECYCWGDVIFIR